MAEWTNRYSYTEANVKKYAPTSGGVYRLINKNGDKYYVFYVGQSDDLERRLLEHLSSSEDDACIKRHLRDYDCFFRFIEVSSASERDRIEQEQIKDPNSKPILPTTYGFNRSAIPKYAIIATQTPI